MGIRFQCEHCQKRLNVKTHQAGEQCVCPACGRDILIPNDSSDAIKVSHKADAVPSAPAITGGRKSKQPVHATKPSRTHESRRKQTANSVSFAPQDANETNTSQESFQLGKPRTRIESDPFAANARHVWYLRHKHLGEKGPLQNLEVKKLLESNQLPRGYIVWREDWNDWIAVEKVFPHHFQVDKETTGAATNDLQDDKETAISDHQRILILAVVGVVAFLILAVLFYLWTFH